MPRGYSNKNSDGKYVLIDVVIGIFEEIIKNVWRILIGIKSEKQMASSKSVLK